MSWGLNEIVRKGLGVAFVVLMVVSSFATVARDENSSFENVVRNNEKMELSNANAGVSRLPTALVRGFVSDNATSLGVDGATVKFDPNGIGVPAINQTNATGYYEAELATTGTFSILVIKSGYFSGNDAISVIVGSSYWCNITLVPLGTSASYVNGTVIDNKTGHPVEGAKLVISGYSGGYYEATTNDTGFYEQQLLPGEYTITATKEGYYAKSGYTEVLLGVNTTMNFILSPKPEENATVKGYVRDASGNGLVGAQIWLAMLDPTAMVSGLYTNVTITNVEGYFEMNLPVGLFGVNATRMDKLNVYTGLTTRAHATKWMNFTLEDKPMMDVNLKCHVQNENGTPLENIDVTLSSDSPTSDMQNFYTDASGNANFTLYEAFYHISASDDTDYIYHSWDNMIYFECAGDYELTITLTKYADRTVHVTGTVTSGGMPFYDASVDFRMVETREYTESASAFTDDMGKYDVMVAPGYYNVSCGAPGMNLTYMDVQLDEGDNYTLDFVLYNDTTTEPVAEPVYSVNGSVTDVVTGTGLYPCIVNFYKLVNGNWTRLPSIPPTRTDASGNYAATLCNGTYRVEAGGFFGYNASTPTQFVVDGDNQTINITVAHIPARTCGLYGYVFAGAKQSTTGLVLAVDKSMKYTEYTLIESDGRYELDLYPSIWEIAVVSAERGINSIMSPTASFSSSGYSTFRMDVFEESLSPGVVNRSAQPCISMLDDITMGFKFNSFSNITISMSMNVSSGTSKFARLIADTVFGNRDGMVTQAELDGARATANETGTPVPTVLAPGVSLDYFTLDSLSYKPNDDYTTEQYGMTSWVSSNVRLGYSYSSSIELLGAVPTGTKVLKTTVMHGGITPLSNITIMYDFGALPQPTVSPLVNATTSWSGNQLTIATRPNMLMTQEVTFTFPGGADTTPPTLSGLTQLTTLPENAQPTINVNATDASGVASVVLHYIQGVIEQTSTMTLSGGVYTTTIGPLSSGTVEYWVTAQDNIGNTATSTHVIATVSGSSTDITPPSISDVTQLSDMDVSPTPIGITATVTDASGISSVILHYIFNGTTQMTTMAFAGLATYSTDIGPFSSGTLEYWVTAQDTAGNVATSPHITITFWAAGALKIANFTTITLLQSGASTTIYANITNNTGATTVMLVAYYGGAFHNVTMTAGTSAYSATLGPVTAQGYYRIMACDANGCANSSLVNFIIQSAPTITDVQYSPSSATTRDSIEVSCIVTSSTAVTVNLTYVRNGVPTNAQMQISDGRYRATLAPMSAPFDVNITATDSHGNSRSATQSISVSSTMISITMSSSGKLKPKSVMYVQGTITVNGAVNATGMTVKVFFDDKFPQDATVYPNGTYICNYVLPSSIARGTHVIKAIATCGISGANGTWTTSHKYTPPTTTGGGPCGLPFAIALGIASSLAIVVMGKKE